MGARQVRALLMGGQACVFYGAAEFSRDADLAVLTDAENLERLKRALEDLQAEQIAVPPFDVEFLERGHAVHFRCHHPEAAKIRVDIMAKMRGVEPFAALWERRTSLADTDGTVFQLLALPDLVQAKKTQRNKDWPMIQRLMEAHYLAHAAEPSSEPRLFWLRELRTPQLLLEAAQKWPKEARELAASRPLLEAALSGSVAALEEALVSEEKLERERDRAYWQPLKAELELLRHKSRRQSA